MPVLPLLPTALSFVSNRALPWRWRLRTASPGSFAPGALLALACAVLIAGGASTVRAAEADSYPDHAITMIEPFAAGSASDVVTRILTDRMSKSLGQTIVVENRPGAGGNTGTAAAARATPDGYTLVASGTGPVAANVTLYRDLGYDPQKDLEPISPFADFTTVVAASTKLPVNTLAQLIAYAKEHPGLNFGSVGIGSQQHLAGAYFELVTGVKLTHVPYKNITQFGPDMIAGQVPLGFQWLPNVLAPLNAGGARALAVAGKARLAALPDVPTTIEAGLPAYQASGWFAMLAPHGTPQPIIEKLNRALAEAIADPQLRARFEQEGAAPTALSLADSRKFVADEIVKWRDVIEKAGLPKID